MPAVRFAVRGRVQGVGFRWFTTQVARRLDLRGWVRNLDDGSVEIVAAGTAAALAELDVKLRRGPAGSHVESVSREDAQIVVSELLPFASIK